ncbi:MptD family putative ECF transporter S component [Paenibacillus ehimensis]|uniref:MptD family putative ECF transporter S component n=1 Tax=Paenibacillus ehimensis TaxID=79264 RepID=A0ABT8VBA6_9BACL|nr:MptD family putative ECF transporter S component [Paenibacillus ehimensis]MDO3678224.1 MptD family putative ECF transporter S component [Paenibacillus ehimensis]
MQELRVQQIGAEPRRWSIKDVVTCVIFNIVIMIVMTAVSMSASMFFTPAVAHLAGPGIMALLCGPLYMVMAGKISKRGVLMATSVISVLLFLAMGLINMLFLLGFGMIAELVMAGRNSYRNWKRNAAGYSIFFAGFALCAVIPLLLFKQKMIEIYSASYSQEAMNTMFYYYETPSMVAVMVSLTVAGSVLGCYFGNKFLNRHVKKAKLI